MHQGDLRTILGDTFKYRFLTNAIPPDELAQYKLQCSNDYKVLLNRWDSLMHTEWAARHFLACKMIFAATLMGTSLQRARKQNLKVVIPYLYYYMCLHACRAVLFTCPDVLWQGGELIRISHRKAIRLITERFSKLGGNLEREIEKVMKTAKQIRELFSYRFPALGLESIEAKDSLPSEIQFCGLLVELAQYHSEILSEEYITRHPKGKFELDEGELSVAATYRVPGYLYYTDREDDYRLDYMVRKYIRPLSLHLTMTEGMVEDFFVPWDAHKRGRGTFTPSEETQIIFPCP